MSAATYTARWLDSQQVIYSGMPSGNLIGALPLGAWPCPEGECGTMDRKDGGDPYEHAVFRVPSGRLITIKVDVPAAPIPPEGHERCGATCPEEPKWSCSRLVGHMGRHESASGGDWHEGHAPHRRPEPRRYITGDVVLLPARVTETFDDGSFLCEVIAPADRQEETLQLARAPSEVMALSKPTEAGGSA